MPKTRSIQTYTTIPGGVVAIAMAKVESAKPHPDEANATLVCLESGRNHAIQRSYSDFLKDWRAT